jgi:hypothetical protein
VARLLGEVSALVRRVMVVLAGEPELRLEGMRVWPCNVLRVVRYGAGAAVEVSHLDSRAFLELSVADVSGDAPGMAGGVGGVLRAELGGDPRTEVCVDVGCAGALGTASAVAAAAFAPRQVVLLCGTTELPPVARVNLSVDHVAFLTRIAAWEGGPPCIKDLAATLSGGSKQADKVRASYLVGKLESLQLVATWRRGQFKHVGVSGSGRLALVALGVGVE